MLSSLQVCGGGELGLNPLCFPFFRTITEKVYLSLTYPPSLQRLGLLSTKPPAAKTGAGDTSEASHSPALSGVSSYPSHYSHGNSPAAHHGASSVGSGSTPRHVALMMRDSAASDDILATSIHGIAAPSKKILSNGCGLVEGGDGIDPDLAAQYEGGPFPMVLIQAPSESLGGEGGRHVVLATAVLGNDPHLTPSPAPPSLRLQCTTRSPTVCA